MTAAPAWCINGSYPEAVRMPQLHPPCTACAQLASQWTPKVQQRCVLGTARASSTHSTWLRCVPCIPAAVVSTSSHRNTCSHARLSIGLRPDCPVSRMQGPMIRPAGELGANHRTAILALGSSFQSRRGELADDVQSDLVSGDETGQVRQQGCTNNTAGCWHVGKATSMGCCCRHVC